MTTPNSPAGSMPPLVSSPLAPPPPPAAAPLSVEAPAAVQNGVDRPEAVPSDRPQVVSDTGHLRATDVSCWFSGRKVLERCSLDMPPGRVTSLIGPSGCGKSTFIRTLNRMHELVPGAELAGSITLDESDIYGSDVAPATVRSQIGMVFQKPNPFPSMTIRENVLAGLALTGRNSEGSDDLVEQSLQRAGLWNEVKDRLDESGAGLSGGQQQRLCIARSLAVSPSVLLMDEPCSALDPISTRVIEETITELYQDVTIVIVTHNMQQAHRISHTCAFFLVEELGQPGRIVEIGDTEKMFSEPDDPRTLDYVTGRFG